MSNISIKLVLVSVFMLFQSANVYANPWGSAGQSIADQLQDVSSASSAGSGSSGVSGAPPASSECSKIGTCSALTINERSLVDYRPPEPCLNTQEGKRVEVGSRAECRGR